ncbi:MAG: T9SS type A sorting domain-containing protein [Ignavibacteriaceae bacterium]|nr:T9SS type A sorting domain-containing protein [Ignavibacteriaceae bacterium]
MQANTNKIKLLLKKRIFLPIIFISSFLFLGWGGVGHSIINYRTILSALPEMEFFETWADSLQAHASDADQRKSWDPTEGPKHYIDIDNYPEFIATGTIPQDFDSLVAIHGLSFVMDQGILPWTILKTADSIQAAFEINDMHKAMLFSADLGHYIADGHMPLHITRNYNGQYTNQTGVHSRYESSLIGDFQSQIIYDGDSLEYIENLSDFVFNMLYENYQYVDSVLYADSVAEAYAGNHNTTTYYNKFWEIAKNFTIGLFQKASYRIACVIYTEWIDAGGLTDISDDKNELPSGFNLSQNYPNPFNPSTAIKYTIPSVIASGTKQSQFVTLKVYDLLGNEVVTLINEEKSAGSYEVNFNAAGLPSGIYFYKLQAGSFIETRKMVLLK